MFAGLSPGRGGGREEEKGGEGRGGKEGARVLRVFAGSRPIEEKVAKSFFFQLYFPLLFFYLLRLLV